MVVGTRHSSVKRSLDNTGNKSLVLITFFAVACPWIVKCKELPPSLILSTRSISKVIGNEDWLMRPRSLQDLLIWKWVGSGATMQQ
jgi:hypothetical protein